MLGPGHVLREAYLTNRMNKELELRLSLAQGLLQCATGEADGGVKLLAKTVEKTKDDYGKHAWGHGAYYMEYWGIGALRANRLAVAEEAFLEALAHDAGSVRGAVGMMVVCERMGRTEEMNRFAELAQRCWRKADAGLIQSELEYMRSLGVSSPARHRSNGSVVNCPGVHMKRAFAFLAFLTSISPASADPCKSDHSPTNGRDVFVPRVRRQERGQQHCYVCESADKPIVVFANDERVVGQLVKQFDSATKGHKAASCVPGLPSWPTIRRRWTRRS